MLRIGLTGGIGSGKTTVANFFEALGVPIIDADKIAYDITQPNTQTYQSIINHFGEVVLQKNKLIDRKKLREIIFKNPEEKKWLEQLLHPFIIQEMKQHISKLKSPYCILVIPLLAEFRNKIDFVDRILVVDAPQTLQIERAKKRDNVSHEMIEAITQSQSDRDKRLKMADDIIKNDGDILELKANVEKLHQSYLKTDKSL